MIRERWSTEWKWATAYWRTCAELWRGMDVIDRTLDLPLQQGQLRAVRFSVWSVLCLSLPCLWLHTPWATVWQGLSPALAGAVKLGITAAAMPSGYGLLRLYTLVAHVLTTNVFKVRGQRLRLLNVETTLLAMCPPAALGLATLGFPEAPLRAAGACLLLATLLRAAVLVGYGYNLVYHRRGWSGFLLFAGGTILTGFVFAIGALAIAVAAGVVSFFALLFLRGFHAVGQT